MGDAWEIVQNVSLDNFSRSKIAASVNELKEEKGSAASSQAMHRRAPPAAHTPRASRPPRDQNETIEACSSAANTPRGSSRATARRVPAPRRSRLVGSLAGVTEIQELAVAIIVDERLHQISCSEAAPQTRELQGHRGRVGSSVEVMKRSHL